MSFHFSVSTVLVVLYSSANVYDVADADMRMASKILRDRILASRNQRSFNNLLANRKFFQDRADGPPKSRNASLGMPANIIYVAYQRNYYNYDKFPPYLSENVGLKTAKSAAENRKNYLSFTGFGPVPRPKDNNVTHLYDYETVSSNRVDDRILYSEQMPPTTVPPVLPVPELATKEPNLPSGTPTISQGSANTAHTYTPACARSQLQTICLDDPFYPTDLVKEAVLQQSEHFTKLYAEVAFQSADNLCDGLSRTDEEKYCNVFSQIHPISASNSWTVNHLNAPLNPTVASATTVDTGWQLPPSASAAEDLRMRADAGGHPAALQDPLVNSKGYVCPSVIHYARIMRAKNHRGQWRVIVNIPGHTQTARIEECTKPLQRCQYISPKLGSACIQKWNFQRLLAWDKYNGFEMDIFRLPVACSCFIRPKTASPLVQSQRSPMVVNNMAPPFVPAMSLPKPVPVQAPSNPVSASIKISTGPANNRNIPQNAPQNLAQQIPQKVPILPMENWKDERPKNVLLQQGSPSLTETDHWLAMQSPLHPSKQQRGFSGQGNGGPIDNNAVQLYHHYLANMYPYQLQDNRQTFPSNLQMLDRKRQQRLPSRRND